MKSEFNNQTEVDVCPEIPKAQATILRLYWSNIKRNGEPGMSFRSFLACVAGSLLYKAGKTDEIIVCVGHQWGENFPALSSLAKGMLVALDVPAEKITTLNTAIDTKSETKAALDYAKEKGIEKLSDAGFEKHGWTRKFSYRGSNKVLPPYITVEKTIVKLAKYSMFEEDFRYLLHSIKNSPSEAIYGLYEGAKYVLFSLKLDPWLEKLSARRGKAPSPFIRLLKDTIGWDMDIYKYKRP